jgi:arylsulfatase A-like enzyme
MLLILLILSLFGAANAIEDHNSHHDIDNINNYIHNHNIAPPHIVFMLIDDLGYADIGYHKSQIPTPHINCLAEQGVKLENYYVQPLCTPTRAALLTGRYNIRYGMQSGVLGRDQPFGLPLSETTLPQTLQDANYITHAVGKWNLGHYNWASTPTHRGFDTFYGFYGPDQDHFAHTCNEYGPNKGFGGYDHRMNETVDWSGNGGYSTEIYAKRVVDIVRNYDVEKNQKSPLFIYFAPNAPHAPLQAPENYVDRVRHLNGTGTLSYQSLYYAACVVALDDAVQNITNALKEAGIWGNTLIVFSTDNGGMPEKTNLINGGGGAGINWPLRGGKGTLYEGGVKGIGFISGPVVPVSIRNTTNHNLFHVTDWFPTLVGRTVIHDKGALPLDGVDQWPALIDSTQIAPRNEVLHSIDTLGKSSALRVGDWKIITGRQQYEGYYPPPDINDGNPVEPPLEEHSSEDGVLLFNIRDDPHEHTSVAEDNCEMVKDLMAKIGAYTEETVPPINQPSDPQANPIYWHGVWSPWME